MRLGIVEVVIEVADRRPGPDARRHLRVRALLLARGLVFPTHEVGPNLADEGELLAVRKPLRRAGAGGHVGHAARFAAVDRDHVELALRVFAALRDERHPLAVGAHGGLRVTGLVAGQLSRGATGDGHQPQVGEALVLGDVERRHRHHGLAAVGCDRRSAEALQAPHLVGGELAGIGRRRLGGSGGDNRDEYAETDESAHEIPWVRFARVARLWPFCGARFTARKAYGHDWPNWPFSWARPMRETIVT